MSLGSSRLLIESSRKITVKSLAVLSVAAILFACATSTGVVPMDQGTYFVSKSSPQVSFGPPITQKADIYKEANAFCGKQNKTVGNSKAGGG
jgi:hypothetical protein